MIENEDSKMIATMQELLEGEFNNSAVISNPQFRFNNDQYNQLEVATIVCGSISVVAIMSVLAMYTYLLFYYPRDANRVSLHCVIASSLLSLLDHCFNLAALRTNIYSPFCDAFRAIDGFVTLASSCLLGMVGVHLLLVFYFHVRRWPCRPEYILIPLSLIYAVIGNIAGYIYNRAPPDFRTIYLQIPHLCWYYSNFIDRLYNATAWIYYYSFVFFILVVSFFCSLIAMRRVYKDKVNNHSRLTKIAARNTANASPISMASKDRGNGTVKHLVARSIQDPDSFSKIVIRSLLYPLTPCLVYIWGFGLQMYLIQSSHKASFGIAVMNIVMTRLEGFFIACIFFMDPTVHRIQVQFWTYLKSLLCCCRRRRSSAPAPEILTTPANKPESINIPDPHLSISSSQGVTHPEPLLLSPTSISFLDLQDSRS